MNRRLSLFAAGNGRGGASRRGRAGGKALMTLLCGMFALLPGCGPFPAVESGHQAPPISVETYEGTFATVNSFIVSNGKSLVIIDAQRKSDEAEKLVARVKRYHLPVTDIVITHGHTDHFTGMPVLLKAFPAARIVVAKEAIRRDIKNYAIYMGASGATAAEPVLEPALRPRTTAIPDGFDYERTIHVLPGNSLVMDGGGRLELTANYKPTEAPHMTTIYIPAVNALFLSDLGYNHVHFWMGDDLSREAILNWRAALESVLARYKDLNPTVYPGHGPPGDLSIVKAGIGYIDDILRVTTPPTTRARAFSEMIKLYPDYKERDFFLKYSLENLVPL